MHALIMTMPGCRFACMYQPGMLRDACSTILPGSGASAVTERCVLQTFWHGSFTMIDSEVGHNYDDITGKFDAVSCPCQGLPGR